MKDKIYYSVLILLLSIGLVVGFWFQFNAKFWFVSVCVFIIYLWSKGDLTGKKLFERSKPKTSEIRQSTIIFNSEEEYQKYVEENYTLISDQEKDGYIILAKYCVATQKQNELIAFFRQLRDFSKDEEYLTTLNYVMDYCDSHNLFFIMALDVKSSVETLEWRIRNSMINNFNMSIDLPMPSSYEVNACVSSASVFKDYDLCLRNVGFQIGYIDTESDEYVILLHKLSDVKIIEDAVNKIGYKYYEKLNL